VRHIDTHVRNAVRASFIGNTVLFLLKAGALILVNSLALATDLGISLVALIVSFILYHAVTLAERPADPMHNYGYGKVEHVCEALEGVILIGMALAMSFQAVMNLFHPRHVNFPWLGFGISCVGVAINFLGAAYILSMAEKSKSPAVRAEGLHYRLEGYISLTIALAFLSSIALRAVGRTTLEPFVDPAATILVSVFILLPSFALARAAFFKLLDVSLEETGKIDIVTQLARHVDAFCDFADLRTRVSGKKRFIECTLIMPDTMALRDARKAAAGLEEDIRRSVEGAEVTVQVRPCQRRCAFAHRPQACPYQRTHT